MEEAIWIDLEDIFTSPEIEEEERLTFDFTARALDGTYVKGRYICQSLPRDVYENLPVLTQIAIREGAFSRWLEGTFRIESYYVNSPE